MERDELGEILGKVLYDTVSIHTFGWDSEDPYAKKRRANYIKMALAVYDAALPLCSP